MNKLSSKILQKIKEEKVTPKPRWYFVLMHTLLGTAILTTIIIGGIAVAIVMRHYAVTDWALTRQFAGGHLRSFFLVIPYIWFILIGLTILLADTLFKHTKKGYRVKLWQLVTVSVIFSVILGGIFFFVRADRPVEESLRANVRPYAQWIIKRERLFAAPEKGVLAGEIILIDQKQEWILVDFNGKQWFVDVSNASSPLRINFKVGMYVGMIGEMTDQNHFKAVKINLWREGLHPLAPPTMINIEINERKIRELP